MRCVLDNLHPKSSFLDGDETDENQSRVIFGGIQLREGKPLTGYGVKNGSTLFATCSLFGGGCDGGTTALQRKFMSQATTKLKDEARDLSDELRAKWEMCAASGAFLYEPIVCCELGYLYNKEAILKQMATKTAHANFKHVRRLKDLVTLQLTPNPDYDPSKGSQTVLDWAAIPAKYVCPITTKPANGKCPFVAIRPCGHVLSEQVTSPFFVLDEICRTLLRDSGANDMRTRRHFVNSGRAASAQSARRPSTASGT